MEAQVIIIGGGLAGLSAAHTVLEKGGAVLLLDKMKFLGGNSTRATSGINGARMRAVFECARWRVRAPARLWRKAHRGCKPRTWALRAPAPLTRPRRAAQAR